MVHSLDDAAASVRALGSGAQLKHAIAALERSLELQTRDDACNIVETAGISPQMLEAALVIKELSSQIDVKVHAVGILVSLPYVLAHDEHIESLSLGAGNTGRSHDLETDQQIAEFKFINWRGGPESIRQNSVFIDLFNLASEPTAKRRVLYVLDKSFPIRFFSNNRAIASVLSKDAAAMARFKELHGDTFTRVRQYFESVRGHVEIIDLRDIVPAFSIDNSFG